MINEAIITALYTISGAIIIYLISEWVKLNVIDPYNEYKNVKAEIAKLLIMYANIYYNPESNERLYNDILRKSELRNIGFQFRTIAASYAATVEVLPLKCIRQVIREIPSDKENNELIGALIGLSNGLSGNNQSLSKLGDINVERVKRIQRLLKFTIVKNI